MSGRFSCIYRQFDDDSAQAGRGLIRAVWMIVQIEIGQGDAASSPDCFRCRCLTIVDVLPHSSSRHSSLKTRTTATVEPVLPRDVAISVVMR